MNSTSSKVTVFSTDTIIRDMYEGNVYNWVCLSCTVLLFYAALLKLSQEIKHIWTKHFSVPTWLYIFARYGALVEQGLLLSKIFTTSESSCNILVNFGSTAASFLSYTGVQGLLITRAYALWPSKILAMSLAFGFFSSIILHLYDVIAFPRCGTGFSNINVKLILSSDISTVCTDFVVFCVCMCRLQVWSMWKSNNEYGIRDTHSLLSLIIKQSILRCCFVVFISLTDLVLRGAGNTSDSVFELSQVFNSIQNALSSILMADFMLDLRELNSHKIEVSKAYLPSLRFTTWSFVQHVRQSIIVELATPEDTDVKDSLDDSDYDHDSITESYIKYSQTA